MTLSLAYRGRRLMATALARAESWLLEPVDVEAAERPPTISLRPAIAVVALAPRIGTTTVARALATELAGRDPAGAAACTGAWAGPLGLGGPASGRLARAIGTAGGRRLRSAGRICLVDGGDPVELADALRPLAPLVLDVAHGEPAGIALSLADHVALVASPAVEPSLAEVAGASMGRIGPAPATVLNRADSAGDEELDRWAERADYALDDSRVGARLVLAGRDPRGALGADVQRLADMCEPLRSDW